MAVGSVLKPAVRHVTEPKNEFKRAAFMLRPSKLFENSKINMNIVPVKSSIDVVIRTILV